MMQFEPIFFKEKLNIINPTATLAIVTLWSGINFIYKKLEKACVNLSRSESKIAVIGNLYGEGFRYLLRNLLYNPQINTLLVLGKDRSGSYSYLINFFTKGIEAVNKDITYQCALDRKKVGATRIIGTEYIMDDLITPDMFHNSLRIERIEGIEDKSIQEAASFIDGYHSKKRIAQRILIEVPEVVVDNYPSNVRGHTIIEQKPSKAWQHLVHRLFRFGNEVSIEKGKRRELQNVKVVIENPIFEDDDTIIECGFSPDSFVKYQKNILCDELPSDADYTYGHRIRAYFGIDCIEIVSNSLMEGLDDRNCYITTWDNFTDITAKSRPCLVSLFFRKDESCLYLTATFRTHNASNAWFENVYGLMALQQYVCGKTNLKPGAITVISHSISLDPQYLEKVKIIHDVVARTSVQRRDPNGHFTIKTDGAEIIVEHWHGSSIINEYKAHKPEKIQYMLYRDCAISDISHAIYIGRQLQKAYQCIQNRTTFEQE